MKNLRHLVRCNECGAHLSPRADSCAECGYPQLPAAHPFPEELGEPVAVQAVYRESRILRWSGLGMLAVGAAASVTDARFAAAITAATGGTLYLAGLLSAWWNRRQ